jgi:hypothetical protein
VCTQDGLDDETFEHHRSGLIADKLEKEPSLSYQTGDYWSQIVDKRYFFIFPTNPAFEKSCIIIHAMVINACLKSYLKKDLLSCLQGEKTSGS